jgi:hypothetical protein
LKDQLWNQLCNFAMTFLSLAEKLSVLLYHCFIMQDAQDFHWNNTQAALIHLWLIVHKMK